MLYLVENFLYPFWGFEHTYGNKCYFMLSCFNRQFEYVNRIIL